MWLSHSWMEDTAASLGDNDFLSVTVIHEQLQLSEEQGIQGLLSTSLCPVTRREPGGSAETPHQLLNVPFFLLDFVICLSQPRPNQKGGLWGMASSGFRRGFGKLSMVLGLTFLQQILQDLSTSHRVIFVSKRKSLIEYARFRVYPHVPSQNPTLDLGKFKCYKCYNFLTPNPCG